MSSGVGGVDSSSSVGGGRPTPPIKNEFTIAGGAYSATVIVGTLEKHGYKMNAGKDESQVLETIIGGTPKEWNDLKGKVESIVTRCLWKRVDGKTLLVDAGKLGDDVQLLGFFSGGVKVSIGGKVKSVKCDGFDDDFKKTMEEIGDLAVKAGVATKDEGGLGFTAREGASTRPNPLENLTMPPYDGDYDGDKGADFTAPDGLSDLLEVQTKYKIANYLNQFAAENPEFKAIFDKRDDVVPETKDPPEFSEKFMKALDAFIATAQRRDGDVEGTSVVKPMQGNLIDDFRQAVLERVQAAGAEPLNPTGIKAKVDDLFSSFEEDVSTLRDSLLSQPPDVIKGVITRFLEPTDNPALRQRNINIAQDLDHHLSSLYDKGGDITFPLLGFPIVSTSARVDIKVVAEAQKELKRLIEVEGFWEGKEVWEGIKKEGSPDKKIIMEETVLRFHKIVADGKFKESDFRRLQLNFAEGDEITKDEFETLLADASEKINSEGLLFKLDHRINANVDEFLNSADSKDWGTFKEEKLSELRGGGGGAPSTDLFAARLNTLLDAHIVGKIMNLDSLTDEGSKDKLTQAKKILTEEFNEVGHPDLDDLKYIPESGGEFTVDFGIKEHRQGVAWAMTQLGFLRGERKDYFDVSGKLKVSIPPLPNPTGSVVVNWDSKAGKAALAYFEAGLGAKFPEGEE